MKIVIKAASIALFIHTYCFCMQALSNSLFAAIECGMVWRVNELIEREPSIVHTSDDHGYTPLSRAVWYENVKICTILLDLKVDPNQGNRINITPLHTSKNSTIVELLLKAGADPNAKDNNGWDALRWAALHRDSQKVELLLRYGAHVQETLVKRVETDVYYSCCQNLKDLIINAFYEQQKLQRKEEKEDVSIVPIIQVECCICMESFADTVIKQIPCTNNHEESFMCEGCCKQIRLRTNACPICRGQLQ